MRALELFSGVGGLRIALSKKVGDKLVSVVAVDNNQQANDVYQLTFGEAVVNKDISNIAMGIFDEHYDIALMSPPCQPFTRGGRGREHDDDRNCALRAIVDAIRLSPKVPDRYFVENVPGFETSKACDDLLSALRFRGMGVRIFKLSPTQCGVPMKRSRVYILAELGGPDSDTIVTEMPGGDFSGLIPTLGERCGLPQTKEELDASREQVPREHLDRLGYGFGLNIVNSKSRITCCITKGYGDRFIGRSGPVVVSCKRQDLTEETFTERERLGDETVYKLSSDEIRQLMGLEPVRFPDKMTEVQRLRLLGNSISVDVVETLLSILLHGRDRSP